MKTQFGYGKEGGPPFSGACQVGRTVGWDFALRKQGYWRSDDSVNCNRHYRSFRCKIAKVLLGSMLHAAGSGADGLGWR